MFKSLIEFVQLLKISICSTEAVFDEVNVQTSMLYRMFPSHLDYNVIVTFYVLTKFIAEITFLTGFAPKRILLKTLAI